MNVAIFKVRNDRVLRQQLFWFHVMNLITDLQIATDYLS